MSIRRFLIAVCCASMCVAGGYSQRGSSDTLQQQISEARQLLANGSIQEAVALLRRLAEASPDDADIRLMLGTALAIVPLPTEAIAELTRAARLRPSARVYSTLGTALARFGEYKPARDAFEEALRLDPESADAHLSLGLLLAGSREFSQAYAHISQAKKFNQNSTRAAYLHYLSGKLLNELGKADEAAEELERAVALQPDHADAWLHLGMARQAAQSREKAARALAKAVDLDPENPTARFLLGQEYLHLDQPDKAIEHLEKARQLLPDDRGVVLNLARALRGAGRADEASAMLKKLPGMARSARSADELNLASQLNTEGAELEKSGNLTGALEKYRKSLEIDPENKVTRRNRALALCRLGRWEEGIAELRALVQQYPADLETRKILYAAIEQAAKSGVQVSGPNP